MKPAKTIFIYSFVGFFFISGIGNASPAIVHSTLPTTSRGYGKCTIETLSSLPSEAEEEMNKSLEEDEKQKSVDGNYRTLAIVTKNSEGKIVGVLQVYTTFLEIYINDIWVHPDYRRHNLGRKMLKALERQFEGKGFENINVVSSNFQAPNFYIRNGFEVEFVRKSKENPIYNKYFLIKYFSKNP